MLGPSTKYEPVILSCHENPFWLAPKLTKTMREQCTWQSHQQVEYHKCRIKLCTRAGTQIKKSGQDPKGSKGIPDFQPLACTYQRHKCLCLLLCCSLGLAALL
ncbi:unknown protein [Oryza sativa Japonica Group]|uniref:Os01g0886900 protein n=2 Tax=Oryza TaxID=4527 RepID=Q5N8G3_ORYSJ|nr:unknown protein [Oryza sativa Japonica Group]BAD82243.1 unknown protein [Oryza sativa Japonica Group]BAH91415.1 Os01g0886900 [Oryza sativa Japonica Group]|eukprot:NP_001172685.1 Os01g0886900 [Oryza sativa Japonica Group]